MNNGKLIGRVHSAMYHQCQRWDYAAPVDVLMDIGVLSKKKYEDWTYFVDSKRIEQRKAEKENQSE
jgi:uncharacterized protein YaiL (DUF2058 family)